jgi:hypothetical protein
VGGAAVRFLSGGLGAVAGAALGAVVAVETQPHCRACEDPGLDQAIAGFLVGAPLGAALGVAAPRLGNRCGFGTRLAWSVAGVAVGLAAGVALGPAIDAASGGAVDDAVAVTAPVGALGIGAATAERCR